MSVNPIAPRINSHRLLLWAIGISLGVHAVLLPLGSYWVESRRTASVADDSLTSHSEVILPLAEWIRVEAEAEAPDLAGEPEDPETNTEAAEKDLGYVRTTENQASLTAPDRPGFVSDRNTVAASPQPRDGPDDLPAVDGEDDETLDVEERRYRDGLLIDESPSLEEEAPGNVGAVSSPRPATLATSSAAPASSEAVISELLPDLPDAIPLPRPNPSLGEEPSPAEEPGPASVVEDGSEEGKDRELAEEAPPAAAAESAPGALGGLVTPAPSTVPVPDRDAEAFQSETRRAKIDGGAEAGGYAAFDAENTPIGRYQKAVSTAIERAWQARILASQDFMSFNVKIRVEFTVNKWGQVENLRVVKRPNNVILTNQTLAAIMEADLPEMPPVVREELGGGDLPCFYNFRVH